MNPSLIRETLVAVARKLRNLQWEPRSIAPQTWADLRQIGTILPVWNGASETALWGKDGNFLIRAWHDSLHLRHGLDFSTAQELELARRMCTALSSDAMARLIEIDFADQTRYLAAFGEFPADQRLFAEERWNEKTFMPKPSPKHCGGG